MEKSIMTNRLRIRMISESDADSIFKLRSAPETFKYVDIAPYQNILRAKSFVKSVLRDIANNEAYFWCIEVVNEVEHTFGFAGTICLWNFDENRQVAEVGYEVLPEYYRKGVATEALGAVLEFVKEALEFEAIHAITHELNIASIKLLMRLNFEKKGIAVEIDPNIEETREMILYSHTIMRA
ncbi:GNAT family N-acetyltransferase [Fusibacter bizertensis]